MARQKDCLAWAVETFGEVATSNVERTRRFLEEAIELAQAMGLPPGDVERIAARVFSRGPGYVPREIGQCLLTLEALAENLAISADLMASVEFDRVQRIPRSEWGRRHSAKVALGIADE